MTRPRKNTIYVITDTIAGKFVDTASRSDGYALVWDAGGDQYIHSAVLTTASVTFETLNANGDVGSGSDQVAAGDHTHTISDITDLEDIPGGVSSITLPTATTVAGRIALAVEGTDYPTGWVLSAGTSPTDLEVEHGLAKRVAYVSVFAVNGTEEQQLFNTAAYNGIKTLDVNTLLIQSLATIQKTIKIYILFT